MVLEQQGVHKQKQKLETTNLDSQFTPYRIIKMDHRTKYNHENIKFVEENIGGNLALGKNFLYHRRK